MKKEIVKGNISQSLGNNVLDIVDDVVDIGKTIAQAVVLNHDGVKAVGVSIKANHGRVSGLFVIKIEE